MSKAREERIKLVAVTFDTGGLGFFGFAAIRPLADGIAPGWLALGSAAVALLLHVIAHCVLGRIDDGGAT